MFAICADQLRRPCCTIFDMTPLHPTSETLTILILREQVKQQAELDRLCIEHSMEAIASSRALLDRCDESGLATNPAEQQIQHK